MTVSRDEVFEILRGVVPRLEEALPGWSVRPNITGTGAVGLYLDGPDLPLAGVNVDGEPVVRHLCGTIQTADRGLPQELGQVRYQYILGVSVAEHESEYPELADLVSVGEPSWVPALRALEALVESEGRETLFVSRAGTCRVVASWVSAAWRCGASSSPVSPGWVWARLTGARACARSRCMPRIWRLWWPRRRAWRTAGTPPCERTRRPAETKAAKTKRRIRPVKGWMRRFCVSSNV